MKCYQPGYPRPQFVRDQKSWENLNGSWDFSFDDKDEGINQAWFRDFPGSGEITLPFTYETPMSGIGDPGRHDVVWYHRRLVLNRGEGRLILHFEGCDYLTSLWINGAFAGSHEGGYARFSFDITHLVGDGDNDITVRAEDSFDITQPRGKQRWKDENFGCWYIQTTGIWKTVWLERVPAEHIGTIKMTPRVSEGTLEIEGEIDAEAYDGLDLEVLITLGNAFITGITLPVTQRRISLKADILSPGAGEWRLRQWTPEHPQLYDIVFRLLRKGVPVDQAASYFGMREIRIDGTNILLNGVPLYQRLILDQGYWKDSHLTPPDEEALIADIDKVLALGYNGVRKHQKIEDEQFLYWCDVKGLLVWSEMAAAYEYNDRAAASFTRQWMEIVEQYYNHPSIITWTAFNESWGIPQIKTNRAQQHFTEAIYHLTKAYDPYRPVIVNDGWEHTVSDIITLHDYEERGEAFLERYREHLEKILDNRLFHSLSKSAFAGDYAYRGQPLILSEFGGIAFNNNETGWGYGSKVNSREEFIKRFDAITTAIKKIDIISGYCYTQVSDVQQEINGLLDADRNFKVDPGIIKEINERQVGSVHRMGRK